jgi:glyoxylase-like metal-dependent hydrolase (beta-lactamase superfamily II)
MLINSDLKIVISLKNGQDYMIIVNFFTFSPIQENTYVLHNENGDALIIDPGCYFTAEQDTLYKYISHNGLRPLQLLNTHCHLDHVFGNKWVADNFNLDLWIHPLEEKVLLRAPEVGNLYGLPFQNFTGQLRFMNDGDIIKFGNHSLKVIHTPGHSPGSVSFYCETNHFLIGGDVLFRESIGRTDLPGADHDVLLESIRKRLYTLPDETIVYSGHGPHTTIGHEKKNNPFVRE